MAPLTAEQLALLEFSVSDLSLGEDDEIPGFDARAELESSGHIYVIVEENDDEDCIYTHVYSTGLGRLALRVHQAFVAYNL